MPRIVMFVNKKSQLTLCTDEICQSHIPRNYALLGSMSWGIGVQSVGEFGLDLCRHC